MVWLFLAFVLSLDLEIVSRASAEEAAPETLITDTADRPLTVLLDVRASTWRPKGRISFSLVPSLKSKLVGAGFRVTEDLATPHDLTLSVDYREEKGRPISINLSGTDIHCVLRLTEPAKGPVLQITVHESPAYAELVSAPYVEVVEKFQSNPYYFFLGELIRGWAQERRDLTGALIEAVHRLYEQERHPPPITVFDTLVSPAETFPDLDELYAVWARENALEEFGRLRDARAVPVLERLLFHQDSGTRLLAVKALAQLDAPVIPVLMEGVAQTDPDRSVRHAAAHVLDQLYTSRK